MQPISLLKKISTCFIAGLTAAFTIQRIIYRTIWEFKDHWIPPQIFAVIAILLVLVVVIIYAIYWHRNEIREQLSRPNILGFWQGVMRFFIAVDLSMIGWQKLFHLQFFTPLGILDQPFSSFSGEALTWAYFGYSYAFTCVIGVLQIIGSFLLLFRRTSLLGCFILFPILLNIICIDFFYQFDAGELAHAIILMVGILYLFFQDKKRLMAFFLREKSGLFAVHFKHHIIPAIIRLSTVLIPVLLIFSYGSTDKNPHLTGIYTVTQLSINQKPVTTKSCQDSVLTTVYFDQGNDIVFEFNSQQKRLIGTYQFNRHNNSFKAVWKFPSDQPAFNGILMEKSQNQLALVGKIGSDSLITVLLRNR